MVIDDPVQGGLVESLSRAGGNLTGNAVLYPELTNKQLELLKDVVSAVSCSRRSLHEVSAKREAEARGGVILTGLPRRTKGRAVEGRRPIGQISSPP